VQDVQAVDRWFGAGSIPAESGVHSGMDSILKGLSTSLLRFPDLDIPKSALGFPETQVQKLSGDGLRSEPVDDAPIEILTDGDILDVGVDHDAILLID